MRFVITESIQCACGCGTVFNKYDSKNRPRTLLNGHQFPKPWQGKKRPGMNTEKLRLMAISRRGEKSSRYNFDNIGYRGIHHWINNLKGKADHCEYDRNHKSTRYHWGNISHEYKRDPSDWMQMCPKCNALDSRKHNDKLFLDTM